MTECTKRAYGSEVQALELFETFNEWRQFEDVPATSKHMFSRQLGATLLRSLRVMSNEVRLKTIRSFCGSGSGRGFWVPLADAYSDQLDRLFAEAERIGLPTKEGSMTLVGPKGYEVGFWLKEGKEPRALWGWGLDPNARRLDGHWYLLCTPDAYGMEPREEMAGAISELEEIAAAERHLY